MSENEKEKSEKSPIEKLVFLFKIKDKPLWNKGRDEKQTGSVSPAIREQPTAPTTKEVGNVLSPSGEKNELELSSSDAYLYIKIV